MVIKNDDQLGRINRYLERIIDIRQRGELSCVGLQHGNDN